MFNANVQCGDLNKIQFLTKIVDNHTTLYSVNIQITESSYIVSDDNNFGYSKSFVFKLLLKS